MAYGDLVYHPGKNNALVYDNSTDKLVYFVPPDEGHEDDYPEDPDNPWGDDNKPPLIDPTTEVPPEDVPQTGWLGGGGGGGWFYEAECTTYRIGQLPWYAASHGCAMGALRNAPVMYQVSTAVQVRSKTNTSRILIHEADPEDPEDEDIYEYSLKQDVIAGVGSTGISSLYTHANIDMIRVTAAETGPPLLLVLLGNMPNPPARFKDALGGREIVIPRGKNTNRVYHVNFTIYSSSMFFYSMRFSDYRVGYNVNLTASGFPRIVGLHGTFYK